MSSTNRDLENIARGGALMAVGLAFSNVSSFLFMAILARVLGPSGYGNFVIGFSVFGVVAAISLMGMDNAAVRFIAPVYAMGDIGKSRFILGRITGFAVGLSLIMTVAIFLLADYIANTIFGKPEVADIIQLFSFCITPFVLSVLGYSALQSIKKVRQQVISRNFIEPSVKLLGVTVFILIPGFWISWSVVIFGLAFLLAAIYSRWQLLKIFGQSRIERDKGWSDKTMLVYSLPLFLTTVFSLGLFRLDILFLGHFGSSADVGIYGAAFLTSNLGIFGLTIANLVFSPYIAASYHNKEYKKLEQMFITVSRWVLILTLPFLALVFLYPGQILSVYGEEFNSGIPVLLILSCAIALANVLGISGPVLVMSGHSRIVLFNTVITSVFAIGSAYFFVPLYGMIGAAISTALVMCMMSILNFSQVFRLLKIVPIDRSSLNPVFAAFGASIPFVLLDNYLYSPEDWKGLLTMIVLYAGLYLVMMNSLGWRKEDAQAFYAVIGKFRIRASESLD